MIVRELRVGRFVTSRSTTPYSPTLRVNPTPTTFFMLFSELHSPTFTGRRSPNSIRSTLFDRGSRQRSMPLAWRTG